MVDNAGEHCSASFHPVICDQMGISSGAEPGNQRVREITSLKQTELIWKRLKE